MSSPEVFVSHRSTDRGLELANGLYEVLRGRGVSAFVDTRVLKAGDDFERSILEHIRRSAVVVVFFDEDVSSWLHFEAACAHFDQKLVPVAVDGAVVPPPYDQLHYEVTHAGGGRGADASVLARVADQVQRRLGKEAHEAGVTRWVNRANAVFAWGVWVVAAIVAATLLPLGDADRLRYIVRAYVVLGTILLGGQFFLSLGFAHAVSSRSFREREWGFEAIEKLFWVWLAVAFVHPSLAIVLIGTSEFSTTSPTWMIVTFAIYAAEVALFALGYLVARAAREIDRRGGSARAVATRHLVANLLFMAGLFAGATVAVFLVANAPAGWLGRG